MEPKSRIMALRRLRGSFRPDAASWVSRSRNFVALQRAIGERPSSPSLYKATPLCALTGFATPWPWEIDPTVAASFRQARLLKAGALQTRLRSHVLKVINRP